MSWIGLNWIELDWMQVKAVIEEQRSRLGYGTHQVLFNIDLYGKTSGTYTASVSCKNILWRCFCTGGGEEGRARAPLTIVFSKRFGRAVEMMLTDGSKA